jgi:hypothetical protein
MVDFLEFILPIRESFDNKNLLLEFPEYKYFTTHLEVSTGVIRFDYWCNDAKFAFR